MKKLLAGVGSVVIAGVLGVSYFNANSADEPKTEEVQKEVVEIPVERTVNLNEELPWRYASAELIAEWQEGGETVYLWSDAEALEAMYLDELTRENEHRAEDVPKINNYVEYFVNELEPILPDQAEYFAKLKEATAAANSGDYETAAALINEAQSLRAE